MASKKPGKLKKEPKPKAESKPNQKRGGARPGAGRKPKDATALRQEIERIESGESSAKATIVGPPALIVPAEIKLADTTATELIRPYLSKLIDNMVKLANGGYRRVSERLEPAGFQTIKKPLRYVRNAEGLRERITTDGTGDFVKGDDGEPVYVDVPAFPDLPAHALVVVQRTEETADRDRAANQYLIDRLEGKPRQAVEVTGKDGEGVNVVFYLPPNGRDPGTQELPA